MSRAGSRHYSTCSCVVHRIAWSISVWLNEWRLFEVLESILSLVPLVGGNRFKFLNLGACDAPDIAVSSELEQQRGTRTPARRDTHTPVRAAIVIVTRIEMVLMIVVVESFFWPSERLARREPTKTAIKILTCSGVVASMNCPKVTVSIEANSMLEPVQGSGLQRSTGRPMYARCCGQANLPQPDETDEWKTLGANDRSQRFPVRRVVRPGTNPVAEEQAKQNKRKRRTKVCSRGSDSEAADAVHIAAEPRSRRESNERGHL